MSRPSRTHKIFFRPSRGMTLVEILTAIGGLVVVGGLALGVFEQTQTASLKMTQHQNAADLGARVMDEISSLLREAIPPENLDNPAVAVAFMEDRATFPAHLGKSAEGLFLVSFEPVGEEGEKGDVIQKAILLAPAGNEDQNKGSERLLFGTSPQINGPEGLSPTVSFRYARQAKPGEPVPYVAELKPGEWPALVEVTIRIGLSREPEHPVVLRTALIPGWLPSSAKSLASPKSTVGPEPKPQP